MYLFCYNLSHPSHVGRGRSVDVVVIRRNDPLLPGRVVVGVGSGRAIVAVAG